MKRCSFGLSDIGVSRKNNEDVWASLPELGFYALADGMGGHSAGEVAAEQTIQHLCQSITQCDKKDFIDLIDYLRAAIEEANETVYKLSKENETYAGMGTTLCCLLLKDNAVIYAHVGDSRIYRLREGKLLLLTKDHSLFSQLLETSGEPRTPYRYKNVITKAIGTTPKAQPEIAFETPLSGDLFLLCSDGLSDVLTLEEIENLLNTHSEPSIAVNQLIEMAKFKGSSDNITAIIVQSSANETDLSRQQRNNPAGRESAQGDAPRAARSSGQPL